MSQEQQSQDKAKDQSGEYYVQLRDKGTTFYDISGNISISGDKVVKVMPTGKILQAIQDGVLVKLDEGKALLEKQLAEMKKKGVEQQPAAPSDPSQTTNQPEEKPKEDKKPDEDKDDSEDMSQRRRRM
jgi:ribosomal protein L12E/L44/L45/RPP1/RPP2